MGFLENLRKNNQYPIIFIGSGITKRYFKSTPTWDSLLHMIWDEVNPNVSYLVRYNELNKQFNKDTFEIYTTLADELEDYFDTAFFSGDIQLKDLLPEDAHNNHISPFRRKIAEIYSSIEINTDMKHELKSFGEMLGKARFIVTTNYDTFIEKELNNAIKVRVGNKGLFEPAGDLNELYKIHGSIKEPNSIMITSEDYEIMKRTSAIVNAKLLSALTESPIIFFGYSLSDRNIQTLLKDLSDNMPFDIEKAAGRIGVVEYKAGKEDSLEVISGDFGVHFTKIETDNFEKVYSSILEIDQGFSPLEISKYKNALKQIIDIKGEEGKLKQVLTSFVNLEKLPKELQESNLVVALGDKRYIYKFPDYVDYIKAYFSKDNKMPKEIALKFILSFAPNSTLPVSKYLNVDLNFLELSEHNVDKLNRRLKQFSSLDSIKKTINVPKVIEEKMATYDFKTAVEILKKEDDVKASVKIAYFIEHIEEIDAEKLIYYILDTQSDVFIKDTNTRKLFMAYSLHTETIVEKI
ncbi:MAG: SIR2 family protein [Lachnospiraceae bacterium]|jgi:hypothetical protein|nr:SIR2 family protein [Lachnospiraceae bacterium]